MVSSSLHFFSFIASSMSLLRIGIGSDAGILSALSTVIECILSISSAEMSALLKYSGFIAAICIATFLPIALNSSVAAFDSSATSNPTITPTEPPAWIYVETIPSILSKRRTFIFSPIERTRSLRVSVTVLSVPLNFSSLRASTSAGSVAMIVFATPSTKFINFSFLATKSVSELTSRTTPFFDSLS